MYIDTHCHLFSDDYSDISFLIDEIKKCGICKIIVSGYDSRSNIEVLKLVSKYDIIYGSLGIHPSEANNYSDDDIELIEKHVNDSKIVAIGEIGLDYHSDDCIKENQVSLFKKQLDLACKYNKPVIIHSRDSIQDTYNILENYKLRGSIHSFSGSMEMGVKFIKLGFLLGVNGIITFKNAKNIVNVIKNIDLKYILLETDSPYLSPEPFRGKLNTPCNIPIISKKISELTNISINDVEKITYDNANRVFDFK